MRLVCSKPYNLVLSLCLFSVYSISQTGVSIASPLLALGALMVYWQAAELGALSSQWSILVNLQFALSILWINRFPAGGEIVDALSRNNFRTVMGILASMSYAFILSQYVINVSSPRFLYARGPSDQGPAFVGPSRLAGLNVAVFTLVPFFFFGSMVNGAFASRFASARTYEIQYWGHLLFGDTLLFLCQLLAAFFLFRFTTLAITSITALAMSFLMGSRSGTVALLLFLFVLFLLRFSPKRRSVVAALARLKKARRGNRALRAMLQIGLLLVLAGGTVALLRTTEWPDARSVRSIFAHRISQDDSLQQRVDLAACHAARYFSHPDEVVLGAHYNVGNCSAYLHSALAVFQILGLLFALPTLVLLYSIFANVLKAPRFSLKVFLLLAPSLVLSVMTRFGFGFFLPALVLALRAQEIHLRSSAFPRLSLYPSLFHDRRIGIRPGG